MTLRNVNFSHVTIATANGEEVFQCHCESETLYEENLAPP